MTTTMMTLSVSYLMFKTLGLQIVNSRSVIINSR